ncbi:MAG: DUF3631 domain-containing protein [Terriglobia bacterium]
MFSKADTKPESITDAKVDFGNALEDIEKFIGQYVILPAQATLTMSLWVIATYLFDAFDAFPYLALLSPAKRCGKTRTEEVLELVVSKPWRGTTPTEAALFRYIERETPTLLFDEVESLSRRQKSERDQAVLSILNCGYKKGQTVIRCVGNNHEVKAFTIYCPKVFAAIGRLPDTLADRSIVIRLQRKMPGDTIERFTFKRAHLEAEPIKAAIAGLALKSLKSISDTYQRLDPLTFLQDRDEEIFSPLFAVCAVVASGRIGQLQKDAKALCGQKVNDDADDSLPLKLLEDLRAAWPEGKENWLSRDILGALQADADGLWKSDVELTPRKLAKMLRPFGVQARKVRAGEATGKGYVFSELEDAISRYLRPEKGTGEQPA